MKTLILSALTIMTVGLGLLLIAPQRASAAEIFTNCGSGSVSGKPVVCQDANKGEASPVNPTIVTLRIAIQLMAVVVGLAAVIGIIISSIRMSIAHGDSSAVASARTALTYSLIGLGVAALAQVIVLIIVGFFS